MVALERAPSKDREIEGSSPLQSAFYDVRLCGGSCSIFASTVILHKAKVSGMQALPSTSPPQWLWFMAEGETGYRNARIEGVGPV